MKWKRNTQLRQIGLTAFLVVAASMLFYFLIFRTSTLGKGLSTLISILNPIIYGYIIAYLLNPQETFIENLVYKAVHHFNGHPGKKWKSSIRVICVFVSLAIAIWVVYALVSSVVPQLISSIRNIVLNFGTYEKNVTDFVDSIFVNNQEMDERTNALVTEYSQKFQNWFTSEINPQLEEFISNITSGVLNFVTFLKNLFLGIIISCYVLIRKEVLKSRFRRFTYSIFKIKTANRVLHNLRFVDEKFGGFIIGKVIDSAIIGFICYFGCLIMKMPYTVLVSVVIGVTNVIPFFGPFIGAIPATILIFVIDPWKALVFVIFIIILQQFDGNFLGPKILGSSVGVSSFMVILSILIGSGFFGFTGMIIGVPCAAIIAAIMQSGILRRMQKKDLPGDLEHYHYVKEIDPETKEFINGDDREAKSLYDRILYKDDVVRSFDEPIKEQEWERTMEQIEREDAEIDGSYFHTGDQSTGDQNTGDQKKDGTSSQYEEQKKDDGQTSQTEEASEGTAGHTFDQSADEVFDQPANEASIPDHTTGNVKNSGEDKN